MRKPSCKKMVILWLERKMKGKQRKNIQSRSNSLNRKTKREKVKGILGEHGGTVEFYCNV